MVGGCFWLHRVRSCSSSPDGRHGVRACSHSADHLVEWPWFQPVVGILSAVPMMLPLMMMLVPLLMLFPETHRDQKDDRDHSGGCQHAISDGSTISAAAAPPASDSTETDSTETSPVEEAIEFLKPSPEKADEIAKAQTRLGVRWPALMQRFHSGSPSRSAKDVLRLIVETQDYILHPLAAVQATGKAVVVVVGITGGGKSVVCNWLSGYQVRRDTIVDEFGDEIHILNVVRPDGEQLPFGVGEDGTRSMTFAPTVKEFDDFILVDWPGFCDTSGPEVRIGMDLAFRRLTEYFSQLRVLALTPIQSFTVGKTGPARQQLSKLMRLLPPKRAALGCGFKADDASGCTWKIGVTKCDSYFMQGQGAGRCFQLAQATVNDVHELLGEHVVNMNTHLFADSGQKAFVDLLLQTTNTPNTPPADMAAILEDVFGCVPGGVTGDCLDPQDTEWLHKRLLCGRLQQLVTETQVKTLELGDSTKSETSEEKSWEDTEQAVSAFLGALDVYHEEVVTAADELLQHSRLNLQRKDPDVDILCQIPQCRLKHIFVRMEMQFMMQNLSEIWTMSEQMFAAAEELNKQGFLVSGDFSTVEQWYKDAQAKQLQVVKDMGYKDMETFFGGLAVMGGAYGGMTVLIGAGIAATEVGLALSAGASIAATGGIILIVAAACLLTYGVVHLARREGNRRSKKLVAAFKESFQKLVNAATKSAAYQQKLARLDTLLESLKVTEVKV